MIEKLYKQIKEFIELDIRRNDLVLEIGGGSDPNFRSDILCDNGEHSIWNDICIIDRPLVIGDAQILPFKDNSFDYIISKSVIEHIDEPDMFFKELMRVGKRGYIEAPAAWFERAFGYKRHKWFVSIENNILVLNKKKERSSFIGEFEALLLKYPNLKKFVEENEDMGLVKYKWDRKIEYQIKNEFESEQNTEMLPTYKQLEDFKIVDVSRVMPEKKINTKLKIYLKLNKLLRSLVSSRKQIDIFDVIACPICKSDLEHLGKDKLMCINCKQEYPIKRGIPILLGTNTTKKILVEFI